jgi:DNA polymerase
MPYLKQQLELIKPRFICCLGRVAAQRLLETKTPLGKMRGQWFDLFGARLMVTYHPAALLRFPDYKRDTWEDVQMLREAYDEWKGAAS